jgi:hypothetical protein
MPKWPLGGRAAQARPVDSVAGLASGQAGSPGEVPLRLADRRFWLWGRALCAMSAVVLVGSAPNKFIDFPQFWSAGRTVGTANLVDTASHELWQAANGIRTGFFAYPPGSAWLFVPFSAFPLALGFVLHALVMTFLVALAGIIGAQVYGLDRRIGLVAAFAWAPCMASAAVGQNAPLALVLALLAIQALGRDNDVIAGLCVGLLLYKPTLALPLLGLLLLRRRWPALGVAAVVAAGWYLLGVAAAAGDWSWPSHWWAGLSGYYATDTAGNVGQAISLPGLLQGYGAPTVLALGTGALVALLAVPRLMKSPIAEAGAGACLVGLAVSPHSLAYEAVLVLPAILWAAGKTGTGISEPARTWLIVVAYFVAELYVITVFMGVSVLAVVTLVAAAIWISGWRRIATSIDASRVSEPVRKLTPEALA